MLDINPDTIYRLIDLAREFHAKEEVVIPQDPTSPSDDWALQALADHEFDEGLQEFKSIVKDLDPEQQYELVALMWLGRGDSDADDWPNLVDEAKDNWGENTSDYLIAHPHLAEFLNEGLLAHGYVNEA